MNSSFIFELLHLMIFPPNFCIFMFGSFIVVLFDMLSWLSTISFFAFNFSISCRIVRLSFWLQFLFLLFQGLFLAHNLLLHPSILSFSKWQIRCFSRSSASNICCRCFSSASYCLSFSRSSAFRWCPLIIPSNDVNKLLELKFF